MDGGTSIEKSQRHRALPGTGAVGDLAELQGEEVQKSGKVSAQAQLQLESEEVCGASSSGTAVVAVFL